MAYDRDILDELADARRAPRYPEVEAAIGMVVEDRASGFCGDVVTWSFEAVTLRDREQHRRHFAWKPGGFLLAGRPVTLRRPAVARAQAPAFTASGSVAAPKGPAKVAAGGRIWLEGRHDAELVEHVWGDDLRELALVVEPMHGIDDLLASVEAFRPSPERRLGILVDHLVTGSKESRLAGQVRHADVMITGHPFVDVWAGVRPKVLGIDAWPEVPRDEEWKAGVCRRLGADPARFWPQLRNRVTSYADLRPELVGAVERLIDFVAPA